jgi:hypothetical protein
VRRSFTRCELKFPKTDASMRAVPLQARALDALERIRDGNGSPLLFPGERGGYLDIHHFRPFQWCPAPKAAGIDPVRRVYDLRHSFATFALRAGISTFDLSRYMGASLTMIATTATSPATGASTRSSCSTPLERPNLSASTPWTLRGRRTRSPAPTVTTERRLSRQKPEAL